MSFLSGVGLRLGIVAAGVGAALMFAGWEDYQIQTHSKATPTTITAAQLSKNGPPRDNVYVHVTDYDLNDEYIIETKEKADNWTRVWLQILPRDRQVAKTGKAIIFRNDDIDNEADLETFGKQDSFDGIVTNGVISSSPPKTPANMHFPDIEESKMWIIDKRNRPAEGTATGLLGGGLAALLIGGLVVWRGMVSSARQSKISGGRGGNSVIGSRNKR